MHWEVTVKYCIQSYVYHSTNQVHMGIICQFMFCLSSDCLSHHAAKAKPQHLMKEGWNQLSKDYHMLKKSVGVALKYLPKRVRDLVLHACKAVTNTGKKMGKMLRDYKVLDAGGLQQKEEEDTAGSSDSHMTSCLSGEEFSMQMNRDLLEGWRADFASDMEISLTLMSSLPHTHSCRDFGVLPGWLCQDNGRKSFVQKAGTQGHYPGEGWGLNLSRDHRWSKHHPLPPPPWARHWSKPSAAVWDSQQGEGLWKDEWAGEKDSEGALGILQRP